MERRTVCLALVLLVTVMVGGDGAYLSLVCPFPAGEVEATEEACVQYSACEWSQGVCHMKDSAGYRVVGTPTHTHRSTKVTLEKMEANITMFGGDIHTLLLEVISHEDYHVQIKISDPEQVRYEVPIPLQVPEMGGNDPWYSLSLPEDGHAFTLALTRTSTGTTMVETVGPLTYEDQFLQVHLRLPSTYVYGLGENMHATFRHSFTSRSTFPLFARDQPTFSGKQNEYGVHPYFMVFEDDQGTVHSLLLYNSNAMEYSTFLLDDGSAGLTLRTTGGVLDFHILMGPHPDQILAQYTALVGRPLLPPYWSLGFGLSRWGYNSTAHVRQVVQRNRAAGVPQDVQTLDIDYMQDKRDFTINPVSWPDLPQMVQELHNDGIRVVIIFDPAIATDFETYPPAIHGGEADAYVKWASEDLIPGDQCDGCRDYVVGRVWPGDTVFPDFFKPDTRQWWTKEITAFHQLVEFDGAWVDMNEPSSFGTNLYALRCPHNLWDDPPYPTHAALTTENISGRLSDKTICMSSNHTDGNTTFLHYNVHSLYGWSHAKATHSALQATLPGRRPLVLSRSTFPGSGRYAIHWLGDNFSTWEQMRRSVIGMLEFNLFGIPMVGADICGFSGHPSAELCARWMQLGAFYPFSRNHNMEGFPDQDPAVWPQVADISRYVLQLRYQYLPYLYTLLYLAHTEGGGVVRPLLSHFPDDLKARDVDDQFLWGSGLMVAPVLEEGATTRDVYFPQGEWYDLVTGAPVVSGPAQATVSAPLEALPLYLLGGAVLPFQFPAINTQQSRTNPLGLTVALDGNGTATGMLFWDDGEGDLVEGDIHISHYVFTQMELKGSVLETCSAAGSLALERVEVLGMWQEPNNVIINEVSQPTDLWTYNQNTTLLSITTNLPVGGDFNIVISV